MDPPQPQPQPPFPPYPLSGVIPAIGKTAAPSISSAQTITEPSQNLLAHLANPSPAVSPGFNLPPYADMIYAAITALKERDGSSKRAIAKYIEKVYTGLPPTHGALLTQHLKRLKNTGLLELVKKSYKLPRSDSTIDNNTATNTNTNTQPHLVVAVPDPSASPSGPKRGRGRPPKPKPNSQPVVIPVGLSISTQPNVVPANPLLSQNVIPPPPSDNNFSSVNVILNPNLIPSQNLNPNVNSVSKRGPGRPKKAAEAAAVSASGKGRGRPPKSGVGVSGVKKSPGRLRKPKSVAANGVKKVLPKRLPKSVVVPYATGGGAVVNVPRPRGRPKKDAVLAASGGAVVVPAKRAGRPPKVAVVKPKKRGARSVGRPRKIGWAATESSQHQGELYVELKRRFEYFQSRVKQAVNVLMPTLTTETAIHAVAELENLASMDINVQLREEAPQPQPPIQQPQPLAPQAGVIQN